MKELKIILLCTIIAACTNKQQDNISSINENKIININLNKEYPQKDIILQDVASIEYIPLETNNTALFKNLNIGVISDKYIIPFDQNNGNIFIFDRKGKFINTFNRQGGAGHEYQNIFDLCFDNKTEEIYIINIKKQCEIYVYSIKGELKRKFTFPENVWPEYIINYDNDYLLSHNIYDIANYNKKTPANMKPYFFISKKTGEVVPLAYEIQKRISQNIVIPEEKRIASVNMRSLIKNGPTTLLSDFGSDTIFSLKNSTLTPLMVKHPSIQENDPAILFSIDIVSDRFIFMKSLKRNFEKRNKEIKYFGYDKVDNKIYNLNFFNAEWDSKKGIKIDNITDSPYNVAQLGFPADILIQFNEKGLLKGKLKEISSKLKEDDNPVLMLIHFNK